MITTNAQKIHVTLLLVVFTKK
jgi:hypothetical protein